MKVKQILPNGNTVLAYFEYFKSGVVLTEVTDNSYVVHRYNVGDNKSTWNGKYSTDYAKAKEIFAKEVANYMS